MEHSGLRHTFLLFPSAVLSQDVERLVDAKTNPATVNHFATTVANILKALTERAAESQKVGANSIVSTYLIKISGPSVSIVDAINDAVDRDCSKATQLFSASSVVSAQYSTANSAIGNGQLTIASFCCTGPTNSAAGGSSA